MLAIVPARGGSVGVRNKVLRDVNGKPMILWILDALARVPEITRTVVSTEDPLIASVCRLHGADVIDRPADLSDPQVPVAGVALHAVEHENWDGPVGLFQPTSPTLKATTISAAIRCFTENGYASLASVVADQHLIWDDAGPLYESRVNRQGLDPFWRETGGIQLASTVPVGLTDPLVGEPHKLFPIPADEGVDIDTPDDLEQARRVLARKTVAMIAIGGAKYGHGHLRRQEALADELSHHDLIVVQTENDWEPVDCDLLILDVLDTDIERVSAARSRGATVVTLEDLGYGARFADLVINELYEETVPYSNTLSGPKYAVLRPEFLAAKPYKAREKADKVLVTFGGTDPARLAPRVAPIVQREAIVKLVPPECSMAEAMREVDLVVTSAGRTVHEAAALGVPCISIAANERESRHSHCAGVLRLGLHATLSNDQIQEAVHRVLGSQDLRQEMSVTSRAQIDGKGTRRIVHAIEGLLEGL